MIELNKGHMNCPCHSGKPYTECCQPFHQGKLPESAEKLMRSRYSAYAMALPDYIIETTDPNSPHVKERIEWTVEILQFCHQTSFDDLIIEDLSSRGSRATVIFFAKLSQDGRNVSFHEKSLFRKRNGRWFYVNRMPINTNQ